MATYEGYVSTKLLTKKDTLKISQTFNDVIQNAAENQFLTDQNFSAKSWPIKLNSTLSIYYGVHYPFYVQAQFLHKIITNNDVKINRIHYQLQDDSFTDIGDNTDTQKWSQPGCIGCPISVITNEGPVLRVHVDNGLNLSNCSISHIIQEDDPITHFTYFIFNNNDELSLNYDSTTKTASGTYNDDNGGIEVSIKELTDKPNPNWYEIKGITKSSNNTIDKISWDLRIPYTDADNSPNYLYVRFYQLRSSSSSSSSSLDLDYYNTVVYISENANAIYGPYTVYFNNEEAGTIPSGKSGEELEPSWNTIGKQNYYKQGTITIGNGVHIQPYKNGDSATYTATLSSIRGLWMYANY